MVKISFILELSDGGKNVGQKRTKRVGILMFDKKDVRYSVGKLEYKSSFVVVKGNLLSLYILYHGK